MKTIGVTEFRRRFSAVIDEVYRTGESVIILRRGKPLARLEPCSLLERYPQYQLQGVILGDIVEPPLPADAWDANRGEY